MNQDPQNLKSPLANEQLILSLSEKVKRLAEKGVDNATEQILSEHSDIDADDELTMSLLYEEVLAAEENSREVSESALAERFPNLADRISRLLAFHQTLNAEEAQESEEAIPQGLGDAQRATLRIEDTNWDPPFLDTKSDVQDPHGRSFSAFDEYEILEKIGQGGMGVVYRARQKKLNRIVALKRLRNPFLESQDRKRLLKEAHAVAQLQHPGIVQIHHVGQSEGQPYLCFEFIEGSQLAERLSRATLAPREASELILKITQAIRFAHQRGIIHRDLKPANILIDLDGQPKVADFGLAKFIEVENGAESQKLTQTGALLGTVCYMSPEQFTLDAQSVDHRADIYGLGTVIYEMLAGRPPFLGNTPDETMYLVRTAEPTSIRKLNPKVPRDLETICLKCLEKDPAGRFQSAEELEAELKRFLNGESLSIRPTSPLVIVARWCRRRPAIASLSFVLVLLLIGIMAGGYYVAWTQTLHATKLQEQRDLSRDSARRAEQKAQEADEATEFMVATLGSAHPNRDGRFVTVAERLDAGLQMISDSFPKANSGKAALLSSIGKTYNGLGLYAEARLPLQQAWELRVELNGYESLEALKTESDLGDLLRKLGHYEEAETHLQHSYYGLTKLLGKDHRDVMTIANCLAQNHYRMERPDEAIVEFAANYELAETSLGSNDSVTLQAMLSYCDALTTSGDVQLARELVVEHLPEATQEYGAESDWVISLMGALADIERSEGNYTKALEQYRQIHQANSRKYGNGHLITLTSLNGVAISYSDLGKHSEAKKTLTEIAEKMTTVLGASHPQTLRSQLNVARNLQQTDQSNEAHFVLGEAYHRSEENHGTRHPVTMLLAAHYGRSLENDNQLVEAERLLIAAVDYFREFGRVDPETRCASLDCLASLYKRTDRERESIVLFEESLGIARTAFGERNPTTLGTKNSLAAAYSNVGKAGDAIELFTEIIADLKATLGEEHPRTIISTFNLAVTYRDEKRSEEAVPLLRQILPVLQRKAPGSWLTCTVRFQLGRAYLDVGELKKATDNLEAAYSGMEKHFEQQPASQTIGLGNQIRVVSDQFEAMSETASAKRWEERGRILRGE